MVLVTVTSGMVAYYLVGGGNEGTTVIATFLAIYGAGAYGRPVARDVVRAVALVALVAVGMWATVIVETPLRPAWLRPVNTLYLASHLILFGAAWVLGDQWRLRRERERQLARRTAELEREREASAEQAATEERLRIARELHDVMGHHVSLMGIQAAGARRVLATDAGRAEAALAAVEAASRQAVAEMRRVLPALGHDPRGETPAPSLGQIQDLAGEVRAAGVRVDVHADDLGELPASLELAVLRVVQEGLTNVLRHAGPGSSARVLVSSGGGTLDVEVTDDGAGHPQPASVVGGTGRGLAGLRERVALHDGHLQARRRPGGGFRLAASLPHPPTPASTAAGGG